MQIAAAAQADVGAAVTLQSDLGEGRAGLSFAWDFGDGGTSTQPQPAHAYATRGDYVVSLTLRNEAGATLTSQAKVQVLPPVVEFKTVRFLDSLHGVIAVNDGMLLTTADGGRHWQRLATPVTSQPVIPLFADPSNGWVYLDDPNRDSAPLFRTTDGGKTWQALPDALIHGLEQRRRQWPGHARRRGPSAPSLLWLG